MAALKTVKVQVVSAGGEKLPGELLACECGHLDFNAFVLADQEHPHLQCAACGVSYCTIRGGCALKRAAAAGHPAPGRSASAPTKEER